MHRPPQPRGWGVACPEPSAGASAARALQGAMQGPSQGGWWRSAAPMPPPSGSAAAASQAQADACLQPASRLMGIESACAHRRRSRLPSRCHATSLPPRRRRLVGGEDSARDWPIQCISADISAPIWSNRRGRGTGPGHDAAASAGQEPG
jgi:hypothetical protein